MPTVFKSKIKSLNIANLTINFVSHTKFLGLWIDTKLNWTEHVNRVCMKLHRHINLFKLGKNFLSKQAK